MLKLFPFQLTEGLFCYQGAGGSWLPPLPMCFPSYVWMGISLGPEVWGVKVHEGTCQG